MMKQNKMKKILSNFKVAGIQFQSSKHTLKDQKHHCYECLVVPVVSFLSPPALTQKYRSIVQLSRYGPELKSKLGVFLPFCCMGDLYPP